MGEKTYSMKELVDIADVPERTIRYYITLELLPKPDGHGRWSHYTEEHLSRLQFIRKLQEGHMPLSEIREFTAALDAQETEGRASTLFSLGKRLPFGKAKEGKVEPAAPEPEKDDEAQEQPDGAIEEHWWSRDPRAVADSLLEQVRGAAAGAAEFPAHLAVWRERSAGSEAPEVGQRTRWERIVLAPGVELNVKMTRSGRQKAAVDALVERARELFSDEAEQSSEGV